MVVKYKPSHKLSVFNLRAGLLRADKGSMNIPEDVRSCAHYLSSATISDLIAYSTFSAVLYWWS